MQTSFVASQKMRVTNHFLGRGRTLYDIKQCTVLELPTLRVVSFVIFRVCILHRHSEGFKIMEQFPLLGAFFQCLDVQVWLTTFSQSIADISI